MAVAIKFIEYGNLLSGFEIVDKEHGLLFDAPHESHLASIGRNGRRQRAAKASNNGFSLTAVQLKSLNREILVVRVDIYG